MTVPLIRVSPPPALASRERLFRALSEALEVQFVERSPGHARVVADVCFGEEPIDATVPTLQLGPGHGGHLNESGIRFTRSEEHLGHLSGWVIPDDTILGLRCLSANRGATTLAEVSGRSVWTTQTRAGIRRDRAVLVPEELDHDETLRSRLTPGRFFGLLPLVGFLRSLDRDDSWHRPPVRATFVMDDPNLHSVRYGYIDFARIARDAARADFHMSMATIPLDGWFISRKAAQIFKAHPDRLSLLVHGNNHTRHELADGRGEQPRLQMIAQALRRVQRFEARSGVAVARVMAPPHGRCSEEVAWDMARLGMESICVTRPFPWRARPPSGMHLTGWFPADTSSAMPVVERLPLSGRPEEIPLRAFLGQPIVLYGHDSDLRAQPDLLASWVEYVARLDRVAWAPLGDISRGLVSWQSNGETLRVRPHTRAVHVRVPENTSIVVVEGGGPGYETAAVGVGNGRSTLISLSSGRSAIPVPRGSSSLEIRMQPDLMLTRDDIADPRLSPWPLMRRALTEVRDRARPWTQPEQHR